MKRSHLRLVKKIMTSTLYFLAFIFLYVFYNFFLKIYYWAWKFRQMDPNLELFIVPFFGIFQKQNENVQKYGDSHRFIKEMIKKNPDQKAYLTNNGSYPFLVLVDPQLIKQYSLNPKNFRKFKGFKHYQKSYKQNIFFSEDEQWASQRSLVGHSIRFDKIKTAIPVILQRIDSYIKQIKSRVITSDSKNYEFQIVQQSKHITGQVFTVLFFSQSTVFKQVNGVPFYAALTDFTSRSFSTQRSSINIFFKMLLGEYAGLFNFNDEDKAIDSQLDQIRKILQQIVDARLSIQESKENDFIQHQIDEMRKIDKAIIEAETKRQAHNFRKITKEQIIQQLIGLYFAGIDTTSHLVAFALYAVAEYPQYRQKLQTQIKQNLANLSSITYQNLQKMKYMDHFLNECLRMWPSVYGTLSRVTRQQIQIGPYIIPKGMLVGTNIIASMHNPKYYDQPEIFNPDRWSIKGPHTQQPYCFVPFSAGPRVCIGKYLALIETKIILIHYLNFFEIQRTDVQLKLHAKFMYCPINQNLIRLKEGGMQIN